MVLRYKYLPSIIAVLALTLAACGTESPTDNASSSNQTQVFRSNVNGIEATPEENAKANLDQQRCGEMARLVNLSFELTESLMDHRVALGRGKRKAKLPSSLTKTALNRDHSAAAACVLAMKYGCSDIPYNCDEYITEAWIKKIGNQPNLCHYTTEVIEVAKKGIVATFAYEEKNLSKRTARRSPDVVETMKNTQQILLETRETACNLDKSLECTPSHQSCSHSTR